MFYTHSILHTILSFNEVKKEKCIVQNLLTLKKSSLTWNLPASKRMNLDMLI